MRLGNIKSDMDIIGNIRVITIEWKNPFPKLWKLIYNKNINSTSKEYTIFGVNIFIIHR